MTPENQEVEHLNRLVVAINERKWEVVEEYAFYLAELVKRQVPADVKDAGYPAKKACPACNWPVAWAEPIDEYKLFVETGCYPKYCSRCGRKLRWK